MQNKAKGALPDDEQIEKASEKIQEQTSDDTDIKVAKAEQWLKDHNKADKAKGAVPDDEQIEKAAEKIQEHTSHDTDIKVAKAEQWAKDHNKD